ncbi:MAG: alanine dehydrogenase, partial [Bacteroidota bacterium]
QEMKEGSVIIDVSIDQGGCVETSRPTTHDQPTFIKHGVIHYCVPNIASRVARTASIAISNIIGPLIVNIGESGGIDNLIKYNEGLKRGIYIYRRHLTKKSMASIFGMNMNYRDIDLLIASM